MFFDNILVYFSDTFNYLDVLIVAFGVMDMVTTNYDIYDNPFIKMDTVNYSYLRIFKIFRIFRVFRLLKVLRKIKAMRKIINGINNSISNIFYTIALLFLFIIIYILIGMSLLNKIKDFNDLLNTLYIVFQALSMENWSNLLYIYYP